MGTSFLGIVCLGGKDSKKRNLSATPPTQTAVCAVGPLSTFTCFKIIIEHKKSAREWYIKGDQLVLLAKRLGNAMVWVTILTCLPIKETRMETIKTMVYLGESNTLDKCSSCVTLWH